MKRILLSLLSLAAALGATAATTGKQTLLYAVKDADSLFLDHYVADVEGQRPCMIFVFGGGFAGGERDNKQYIPYFEFMNDHGYDVVSMDYRLGLKDVSGAGDMSVREMVTLFNKSVRMAVEDLFSATLFVLGKADEWDIDPHMIVTCGSSAGAITVLQAENALCNRSDTAEVMPEDFDYAGVVSFAGAVFSVDGAPEWNRCPAPVMMFHGSADNQVPFEKASVFGVGFYGSKFLVKQFDKRQWPYWFYTVEYQNHSMAVTPMRDNRYEILAFLEQMVRDRRPMQSVTEVRSEDFPPCKTRFKVMDYVRANYAR